MKVEWPAGLAAAGLLATGLTNSKKSIFGNMRRPAWLARNRSTELPFTNSAPSTYGLLEPAGPSGCLGGVLARTPSTTSQVRLCFAPATPLPWHWHANCNAAGHVPSCPGSPVTARCRQPR
jgi:hypothetical protein